MKKKIIFAIIAYVILCALLYVSSWGREIIVVVIVPIIPSILSSLLISWILKTPIEKAEKNAEKAKKEDDPHKKLSSINVSLDNLAKIVPRDFEQAKRIIDILSDVKTELVTVEKNSNEKAIGILIQTCKERVDSIEDILLLGFEKERFEEAVKYFDESINEKDPSQALALLTRSIRFYPTPEALYNRGISKYEFDDLQGAIEDFNEAIRLYPDYAKAFSNRGIAKYDHGDLQGAIEDFDEAIRLEPDHVKAFYNRGKVKNILGDPLGAIEDFNETIRLKPDSTPAFFHRGNTKSDLGDLRGAIEDFDEAIRLKPDYAEAYFNRGLAKDALVDIQNAIEDYDNAIRLKPELARPYKCRAKCNRILAENEKDVDKQADLISKAEADEKISRQLEHEEAANLLEKGYKHLESSDYILATKKFNEAIQLDPNFAEAYYYRGFTRENLPDSKCDLIGAEADYSQALSLNHLYSHAYLYRGLLRVRTENLQGALNDFDEFIKLEPNSPDGYHNRAQIYRLMAEKESSPQLKAELLTKAEADEQTANH